MSKKRYTAALIGHGSIFKALRRAWCTRFGAIHCLVIIPETNETIKLTVSYSATHGDTVLLTTRDNHSGMEYTLFAGGTTQGRLKSKIHKKD